MLVRPCSSLLLIWIFVQSWKHPFARGLRLCEDFDQCWTTVKVFFSRVYKLKAGNFFMPISNNKTRLIDFSGTLISVEPLSKFFFVRVYKLKAIRLPEDFDHCWTVVQLSHFFSRIFAKVCELKAFNLNIFHARNFITFLLILEHDYLIRDLKMTFCLLNSKKTPLQKIVFIP